MLIVPGSFVGHSIICDKCGVTFIAMPQTQQQAPPSPYPPQMPPQMPPAHQPMPYSAATPPLPPMSMPPPAPRPPAYGSGALGNPAPTGYSPGHNAPAHRSPPLEQTFQSMPSVPAFEAAPLPQRGGEHRAPPHPFGNPIPEIEILPPPKAKRQSSRKRSGERSAERSVEGKRSRRRSSRERSPMPMAPPPLPHAPPPLPASPTSPRAADRVSHTALARADHGPSGEVGEIELRIRRAQLRRTMSLAFACVGLLAMSVMGLLMIKYVKPGTDPPAEVAPATPPENPPTETPQPPESSEPPSEPSTA